VADAMWKVMAASAEATAEKVENVGSGNENGRTQRVADNRKAIR